MEASKGELRRSGGTVAFGEEFGDLRLRHRLGEQITLPLVATVGLGAGELLLGLDALDDGGDAEAAGEAHHGADNGLAVLAHQHVADEGAVDLDLVELEV